MVFAFVALVTILASPFMRKAIEATYELLKASALL